jgi:hypothetical protein
VDKLERAWEIFEGDYRRYPSGSALFPHDINDRDRLGGRPAWLGSYE